MRIDVNQPRRTVSFGLQSGEHPPKLIHGTSEPSQITMTPVDLGKQRLSLRLGERSRRMIWRQYRNRTTQFFHSHDFMVLTVWERMFDDTRSRAKYPYVIKGGGCAAAARLCLRPGGQAMRVESMSLDEPDAFAARVQNDPVRLLLIRHAEPEATIRGVVAGPIGCTGLTDQGRAQAAALRDRLARDAERFDVLYSSVLARAVETAQIISPSLDLSELHQDCDLCELHPGECDGMTWEEQVRVYGSGRDRDPDQPMSPGGESLRSFDRRVRAALNRLVERHVDDSVAVVTHGGFITIAMLALLGFGDVEEKRTFVLNPDYTSLSEWHIEDHSKAVLRRYNDTGHLAIN